MEANLGAARVRCPSVAPGPCAAPPRGRDFSARAVAPGRDAARPRLDPAGSRGGPIRQRTVTLTIETPGRGLLDFTDRVTDWVRASGIATGVLTLYVRHTSASLLVQENADASVRGDLDRFLARLVPDGDPIFEHDDEGPDDMSGHVRSALTATSLSIPVVEGRPVLGTWQGIYLYEHRRSPHRRHVVAHLMGE